VAPSRGESDHIASGAWVRRCSVARPFERVGRRFDPRPLSLIVARLLRPFSRLQIKSRVHECRNARDVISGGVSSTRDCVRFESAARASEDERHDSAALAALHA